MVVHQAAAMVLTTVAAIIIIIQIAVMVQITAAVENKIFHKCKFYFDWYHFKKCIKEQ